MASTQDPNEQNFVNTSLPAITNNNVDAPDTGEIQQSATTPTGFYATRTALNATTGQTESDTVLVIN